MNQNNNEYKIGKVSKITGITADTLRVWERRHAAVEPNRSEAGGRLYSVDDVVRLKLIKQLIDNGDSIGNIASLSYEQLQARIDELAEPIAAVDINTTVTIAVVGSELSAKIAQSNNLLPGIDVVANYNNIHALRSDQRSLAYDILVIDQSTMPSESALDIAELLSQFNILHVIAVHRFAANKVLDGLPTDRCTFIPSPIRVETLRKLCLSIKQKSVQTDALYERNGLLSESGTAHPRRFDDESLEYIASMTPVIQCECPRHLAELLSSLVAFETYSDECENRNQEDAELHAYLSRTTSEARHLIEKALEKVIEIENIKL